MDEEQLARIAEDYYLNKLTFGDISDKYKISRYKIKSSKHDSYQPQYFASFYVQQFT
ncbi:hypothetical protein H7R52_05880 [Weissella confusa]|uniref:Uncharacterized protein n=1 Tax=Weissella confusa TaxID=1583 RepID=A0A923NHK1_WEICO|nr:hypothetical protein [Weissella confusa]